MINVMIITYYVHIYQNVSMLPYLVHVFLLYIIVIIDCKSPPTLNTFNYSTHLYHLPWLLGE